MAGLARGAPVSSGGYRKYDPKKLKTLLKEAAKEAVVAKAAVVNAPDYNLDADTIPAEKETAPLRTPQAPIDPPEDLFKGKVKRSVKAKYGLPLEPADTIPEVGDKIVPDPKKVEWDCDPNESYKITSIKNGNVTASRIDMPGWWEGAQGYFRIVKRAVLKNDPTAPVPPARKHTPKVGISKRKLLSVLRKIKKVAQEVDAGWAVIGGAAFKLWGEKYPVKDIDIAALKPIPQEVALKAGWQMAPGNPVNPNDNGHYIIDGVKVDWMYKLDDGAGPLFKRAVIESVAYEAIAEDRYTGWESSWDIPVATPEYAMAIKVNAGREKDVAVFYDFIRREAVDPVETLDLIHRYVK